MDFEFNLGRFLKFLLKRSEGHHVGNLLQLIDDIFRAVFKPKVFGCWNIEFAFANYRDETSNEIAREVSLAIPVKASRLVKTSLGFIRIT